MATKKHDVTAIRVFDPHEEKIPNVGIIPLFFTPGRNTFGITHFRHF